MKNWSECVKFQETENSGSWPHHEDAYHCPLCSLKKMTRRRRSVIPQPGAPVLPASGSGIPRLDFVTYQGSYCTRMSQGLAGGGVVRPCVPATGKGHLFKDSGIRLCDSTSL